MRGTGRGTMLVAAVAALIAGGMVRPAPAQEPIDVARELYASARYDEALGILNGLDGRDRTSPAERRRIHQYRFFCLLALGRDEEARAAVGAIISADPWYQPDANEVSPRIREAIRNARRDLLPDIVRTMYADARETFDRQELEAAAAKFDEVRRLVADPDLEGRLEDLDLLAAGFAELIRAAAAPVEEPPAPAGPRIYGLDEPGVRPPATLRQDLPRIPGGVARQARGGRGLLEVIIDEQGRVEAAHMRQSLHPVYDQMVVANARRWRYRPASVDGTAVKSRKLIQIAVEQ